MYACGSGGLERTEDAFEDVDEEADWIEAGGGEASMTGGLPSFVVWDSVSEASAGAVSRISIPPWRNIWKCIPDQNT